MHRHSQHQHITTQLHSLSDTDWSTRQFFTSISISRYLMTLTGKQTQPFPHVVVMCHHCHYAIPRFHQSLMPAPRAQVQARGWERITGLDFLQICLKINFSAWHRWLTSVSLLSISDWQNTYTFLLRHHSLELPCVFRIIVFLSNRIKYWSNYSIRQHY